MKYLYCLVFLFISCAQITSLNLKKHQFGRVPLQIVWIQLAGFKPEHLALLKFEKLEKNSQTAFEQATCVGHTWEYNLFDIRPQAREGFLSQLTGRSDLKGECSDYENQAIWKYLTKQNYKTGIFANTQSGNDFEYAKQCKPEYFDEATVWLMNRQKDEKSPLFHIDEEKRYKKNTFYYDKSCQQGSCYNSFAKNVIGEHEQFSRNTPNYLFIVRDQDYEMQIRKNNKKAASEKLLEVNKVLDYFQKKVEANSNLLVLVSTSNTMDLNFPKKGNEWRKFKNQNKIYSTKNTKLISTLYASGARAENFCGTYSQKEILSRIFSGAKEQGLEFSIINPF